MFPSEFLTKTAVNSSQTGDYLHTSFKNHVGLQERQVNEHLLNNHEAADIILNVLCLEGGIFIYE